MGKYKLYWQNTAQKYQIQTVGIFYNIIVHKNREKYECAHILTWMLALYTAEVVEVQGVNRNGNDEVQAKGLKYKQE